MLIYAIYNNNITARTVFVMIAVTVLSLLSVRCIILTWLLGGRTLKYFNHVMTQLISKFEVFFFAIVVRITRLHPETPVKLCRE